jgi:hypothetical protein
MTFHLKEFYGNHCKEKQTGKGPDIAGNMVPGFRPHVARDLATNVIINIAYFQGAARAPRIIQQSGINHFQNSLGYPFAITA